MSRDYRKSEFEKMAKAKRERALERREIRGPAEPRKPAASPTSFAVKTVDPETRRMIDEALARRAVP